MQWRHDRASSGPRRLRPRRAAIAFTLIAAMLSPMSFGEIARSAMIDAFTAVSGFVAGTLLFFYGAERAFGIDVGRILERSRWLQVPLAALLGATPGCGGAVVVVAAYSSRRVSFGAVVAALTATMGDAAFLLIATRPQVALVVLPLCCVVGVISGWVVDRLIEPDFCSIGVGGELAPKIGRGGAWHRVYLGLALAGLALGIAALAGWESPPLAAAVAVPGIVVGLWVWATSPLRAMTHPADPPVPRTAEETAFISVAVFLAFLAYEYLVAYAGVDLRALFNVAGPLLPLVAIGVGLIPGCGPQILVTTLYVHGIVPGSALLGNAIANDGDALFPAIVLNPRAAIWATVYSAIPAVVLAYASYFLVGW
ncbi:MAG: hypothetical protein B7733_11345 [Myxococcales bacterium FL481]|nr:MAG: hypothetical protein B7733_11345 [Myxococcales bacterium FL481]